MITIDFSKPIMTLKGVPVKVQGESDTIYTQAMLVSDVLSAAKEGGKYKLGILATNIYKDEKVTIDTADIALIRRSLESAEPVSNVWISQIIDNIESSKEAVDNPRVDEGGKKS